MQKPPKVVCVTVLGYLQRFLSAHQFLSPLKITYFQGGTKKFLIFDGKNVAENKGVLFSAARVAVKNKRILYQKI
jgi:hypothetical protein